MSVKDNGYSKYHPHQMKGDKSPKKSLLDDGGWIVILVFIIIGLCSQIF